jgi:hypothetical protein
VLCIVCKTGSEEGEGGREGSGGKWMSLKRRIIEKESTEVVSELPQSHAS